mgnify:CR=1 FL=1
MRFDTDAALPQRLIALARASPWFMEALVAVRGLGLPAWCIGAGAVRTLVWDALHLNTNRTVLADVDVVYFDANHLAPAQDADYLARLTALCPHLPWEVCNQASVHTWFEACFGHPVEPLVSLEDAVASWPEYATCVGLRFEKDDSLTVIAPYGLVDLFNCVIQRNPRRVSLETYRQRVAQKRYAERWPNVRVLME